VISRACPLFVPLVEEGWTDDPVTEAVARRYLAPLLEARIDTLVLGCTHYPLLAPLLRRVAGAEVELVDSAAAVAEEVAAALAAQGLLGARRGGSGSGDGDDMSSQSRYYVTDGAERFGRLAATILGHGVALEWVDVDDEGRGERGERGAGR
jgi:glutamate racemase